MKKFIISVFILFFVLLFASIGVKAQIFSPVKGGFHKPRSGAVTPPPPPPAGTGIALVSSTAKQTTTASSVTTDAINTTDATLIVVAVGYYPAGTGTLTDSKGNVCTGLTQRAVAQDTAVRLYYCANPTVGTNHTFTLSGVANYPGIAVAAFSGVKTTTPFNVENGAAASGATVISTGSITPTASNALIVTGIGTTSDSMFVPSGFTLTNSLGYVTSTAYGVGLAYKVQTTASATSAVWALSGTSTNAAAIASFLPKP